MAQRAAHVLVDPVVVGVDHVVLLGQHVHGEAVLGHEEVLLSCKRRSSVFQSIASLPAASSAKLASSLIINRVLNGIN